MIQTSPRIVGYDLARGLAIFGMLVVNFHILLHPLPVGPRFLLWFKDMLCGRAAALFVILAGAGLALLSARVREPGAPPADVRRLRRGLLRRSLFLLAAGFGLSLIWQLDILHFYGLFFAGGMIFYRWPNRGLWSLIGLNAGVSVAILLGLPNDQSPALFHQVFPVWGATADLLDRLFFSGAFPLFPWIGFFLFGVWLGRLDLRQPRLRRRLIAAGLGIMGLTAVYAKSMDVFLAPWVENLPESLQFVLLANEAFPLSPLFMLQATALSVVIIAACVALGLHPRWGRWCSPVAAAGQLSLTIYVAHVLAGLALARHFNRLGTALTSPSAILTAVAAFLAFTLISMVWRRRLPHGPLEYALRRFAQG